MTPEQFTYWLQGFTELTGDRPTESQWLAIKDHLKLVFNKITPDRASPNSPKINPWKITPFMEQQNEHWYDYTNYPKSPWDKPPEIIC